MTKQKKTIEECLNWEPKDDHTTEEIIQAFQRLRTRALEWHGVIISDNFSDDELTDLHRSISELALELTLGDEVWDYTNPLR